VDSTNTVEQADLHSSDDTSQTLSKGPYWLDTKIVQFNQTQKELGILEEIRLLGVDDKDNVTLPFKRHERVVIVSKVLWPKDLHLLKRMLCLQKAAYNRFVNYDVVVFTTLPWTIEQVEDLGRVVAPARLTVTNEGPTLEGHLAEMTHDEIVFLEKRCGVNRTKANKSNANLTWFHHCRDGNNLNNLGYSWQSEFRASRLWTHPALRDYKYMIWLDSDSFCSQTWDKDPLEAMVQQNLTLMWTTFYGKTLLKEFGTKMLNTYGEELCDNSLLDGHMEPKRNCKGKRIRFKQVGGFFHITNLDVYREDRHQNFLKELVGDYRFSRKWDDQLAVTVIAAMEDPTRAWRLRSHNFTFNVRHHKIYDGEEYIKIRNTNDWWNKMIRDNWHAGRLLCDWCF